VNLFKKTNQRAAAEILEVEGPGDSLEPVEESGGGGERRGRRGCRDVLQCCRRAVPQDLDGEREASSAACSCGGSTEKLDGGRRRRGLTRLWALEHWNLGDVRMEAWGTEGNRRTL
jgi:hypothetical protein